MSALWAGTGREQFRGELTWQREHWGAGERGGPVKAWGGLG